MAINTLYHGQYPGDFTATGASIKAYRATSYLKAPEITDPAIFQATRGHIQIPNTATVEKAFLVWGADNHDVYSASSSLYFRTPASLSDKLADATYIQTDQFENEGGNIYQYYGFSYDVTDLVKAGGTGDYWVYNFDITPRKMTAVPAKAAWALYVFYKDASLSFKKLNFYAGIVGVGALFTTPLTISLNGIRTPSSAPINGKIGATSLFTSEREYDSFFVETTAMSDAYTPSNDFGNSISTINNALMDTWPVQTVPADINNQEAQTKVINLNGNEVPVNESSIDVSLDVFSSLANSGDILLSVATTFEINDVYLSVRKSVDHSTADIGDILTYNIEISHPTGFASCEKTVLKDVLPSNLTYVPNSMEIINNNYGGYIGALTDAIDSDIGVATNNTITINVGRNATSSSGGLFNEGDTVSIQFKAQVNDNNKIGNSINNVTTISTISVDSGEEFDFKDVEVVQVENLKPVKTANKSYFYADMTSEIDFQVSFDTRLVGEQNSVIVIEDYIDDILKINSYSLDLPISPNIIIEDKTVGNHIQYTITNNGTEKFPNNFNLSINATYNKGATSNECYIIKNVASSKIGDNPVKKSNEIQIKGMNNRNKAINDLIQSVALMEVGLSHVINAEGEKIQKAVALDFSADNLILINNSVEKMISSISGLEFILANKLKSAEDLDYPCKENE